MMGMGYLRLNRILAKPANLPRLTQFDTRLRRFIVVGAIIYVLAVILLGQLTQLPNYGFEYFIFFYMILPVGLLLVLWWTTDVVPLFARVSIVACSTIGIVVSIIQFARFSNPTRFILLFLGAYLLTIASEAIRQIFVAGKQAGGEPVPGEGET